MTCHACFSFSYEICQVYIALSVCLIFSRSDRSLSCDHGLDSCELI